MTEREVSRKDLDLDLDYLSRSCSLFLSLNH